MMFHGTGVSSGIGIGKVAVVREAKLDYSNVQFSGKESEKARLDGAIKKFSQIIDGMADTVRESVGPKEAEILLGQITMLNDPFMISQMTEQIDAGCCAEAAVDSVCNMYIEMFSGVDDELMRQRATDVRDIRQRMLKILLGVTEVRPCELPEGSVLAAHDLTPSMTVGITRQRIAGILTETGGKTSHSAILARAMEIPAVLGISGLLEQLSDGDSVVLDGDEGLVILSPDERTTAEYRRRQEQWLEQRAQLSAYRDKPTLDADGNRYQLYANIGGVADARAALEAGAEGIGLFRTEFLFMDRSNLPTEAEQ